MDNVSLFVYLSGRPCIVSDVLKDLVGAAVPLAIKQQRSLHLRQIAPLLHVAVEESALRQALSNLVEGALLRTQIGGKVEVCAAAAPAGGVLIIINDNGPDMHYLVIMICYGFHKLVICSSLCARAVMLLVYDVLILHCYGDMNFQLILGGIIGSSFQLILNPDTVVCLCTLTKFVEGKKDQSITPPLLSNTDRLLDHSIVSFLDKEMIFDYFIIIISPIFVLSLHLSDTDALSDTIWGRSVLKWSS